MIASPTLLSWTGPDSQPITRRSTPRSTSYLIGTKEAELIEGMMSQDASIERFKRKIGVMKVKVKAPAIPPQPPPPQNPVPMVFTLDYDNDEDVARNPVPIVFTVDDDDLAPPSKTAKRCEPTLNLEPSAATDEPATKKRKLSVILAPGKI